MAMDPRSASKNLTRGQYEVAILCALDKELLAVRALFDEEHADIPTPRQDTNHYALGRIGRHDTVTTCLPAGEYGTVAASEVVQNMHRSFPRVEFCLLVGIGGGVPSREHDIRLGDVVVSHPNGSHPAVLQYDMGKALEDGDFQLTGTIQPPPRLLMKAISKLKSSPHPENFSLRRHIESIGNARPAYRFPGQGMDVLFDAGSRHVDCPDCRDCCGQVVRQQRNSDEPQIHYGPIASGNQVLRSAERRDILAAKHKFLCFEMEAAGVMNTIPCLVIRGICDYSDSHKNKIWQAYAAATAAAYAKELLSVLRDYTRKEDPSTSILRLPTEKLPDRMDTSEDSNLKNTEPSVSPDRSTVLQALGHVEDPGSILQKHMSFSNRRPSWNPWPKDYGSLRLFQDILEWLSNPEYHLLVVKGAPGRSSSEIPFPEDLACHMIQYLRKTTDFPIVWSFSCARQGPDSKNEALKMLIMQILEVSSYLAKDIRLGSLSTEEQIFELLYHCFCSLNPCFIIIEMKDATLAKRLQEVVQRAFTNPGANFKAMIISFAVKASQNSSTRIVYMPSITLRGSLRGWDACWNGIEPNFM